MDNFCLLLVPQIMNVPDFITLLKKLTKITAKYPMIF